MQLRLRIGTAFPEIFEYSTLFSLPRSPCRSRLHDELVNSAQKNRRTRLRPPNMCQGQHRTMQQEHARGFLREALIQSARTDGERFFGKARYGKRRNTLCTRKGHAASVRRQGRRCGGLFNAKGNPDGFLSHYPSLRDFRLGRLLTISLRRMGKIPSCGFLIHFRPSGGTAHRGAWKDR